MYTEFYCDTGGSNLNSGSTASTTATYTSTNGGWNSGTGVFTPTSGNPSLTVSVGDFASIYPDATTPDAVFISRVTAVSSTTITVSTTAKSGSAPTTAGAGVSCKVGGAWQGPNGTSGFPFGFIAATQINASSYPYRVNFKAGTYSITAGASHAITGPGRFQGYTTTPGDGGKFTVDGGTTGASYTLLSTNANYVVLCDAIFKNNGATGTATGVSVANAYCAVERVVVHDVKGIGISLFGGSGAHTASEIEAYSCGLAGISLSTNTRGRRLIGHHNSGAGITLAIGCVLSNSIADSNGGVGIGLSSQTVTVLNCDAYNNTSHGIDLGTQANAFYGIENCNSIKNGGYGIGGGAIGQIGRIASCGFGAGTQANISGTTNSGTQVGMELSDTVTYGSGLTPWTDPANGDFRINLPAAKGTGRGAFTQTQSGYAGAIGYPDIGAAQHLDAGGTTVNYWIEG